MVEMRTPKGTSDYLPSEQEVRESIRNALAATFRLYNFGALETPILENYDILASKYGGGEEILRETYSLQDQAKRNLGLRYDLTVPFARVIAMNPNLKLPFKRWEMGKVFRNGPIKAGRYREFTQCDADVVGVKSMAVDAEFVAMAFTAFSKIGIDVYVEVNNMKVLAAILKMAGVSNEDMKSAVLTVDKLKKIGEDGVREELKSKDIDGVDLDLLFELLEPGKTNDATLQKLESGLDDKTGLAELMELFGYIKSFGVEGQVRLVPSLSRGMGYYTGTIFEAYAKESVVTSSLAAGGRYDNIIGEFLGTGKEYPAIGISFGLEPIFDTLKGSMAKEAKDRAGLQVYVIPIKQMDKAIAAAAKLRWNGIEADVGYLERKLVRELDRANELGVPYVMIIGEKEAKESKVQLRDMKSGEQILLSIEDSIKKIKKS